MLVYQRVNGKICAARASARHPRLVSPRFFGIPHVVLWGEQTKVQ